MPGARGACIVLALVMRLPVILASASPRRRDLLGLLGIPFQVCAADLDEAAICGGAADAREAAVAAARAKAEAVAGRFPGRTVLGADTVVVLDGVCLGKPRDAAEAEAMLLRLQGRTHTVVTGVAVVDGEGGRRLAAREETAVTMLPLSREDVAAYVATGEPLDKAGAYAVQGLGAALVARVEGCYFNVVGLPLARTSLLLRELGFHVVRGTGWGHG